MGARCIESLPSLLGHTHRERFETTMGSGQMTENTGRVGNREEGVAGGGGVGGQKAGFFPAESSGLRVVSDPRVFSSQQGQA